MKSAFKTRNNGIVIRDFNLRATGADELRLKVDACGICGTDFHPLPEGADNMQFGHEIAGTILEIGAGVSGFKIGDKVVLDSATPCGRCDKCRNKKQELCTDIKSFFCIDSFGFAEEMLAPAICAIPYRDLSPEVACLQEPLGVAIDIFKLTEIGPDSNVLVMGQGPIGLMALALADKAGARKVFASDFKKRKRRYELALEFGADAWIDPSETPLDKFDYGCDIDRIIVTSPPLSLPSAFSVASNDAVISFLGIGGAGKNSCSFDADAFHFKKLQLRASFASPALYGPLALQYLKEKVIDGESIVSRCFDLDKIADAMKFAAEDAAAVKVVVKP